MTTPPPVYESPRWLPPPIASTEGRRRLVKLSDDSVLYSGRERGGLRLRYAQRSHASGDFGAV